MNSTDLYPITHQENMNIDNMAQSVFYILIFCGFLSDCTLWTRYIMDNKQIKDKIKNGMDTWSILKNYFLHNYEKDKDGNIIIEDNEEKKLNKKNIKNEKLREKTYHKNEENEKSNDLNNKLSNEMDDFLTSVNEAEKKTEKKVDKHHSLENLSPEDLKQLKHKKKLSKRKNHHKEN